MLRKYPQHDNQYEVILNESFKSSIAILFVKDLSPSFGKTT